MPIKTNLFIIGAAKSATSSFHEYLAQHPRVNMSSIKEPNFFSYKEIIEDNLYYKGVRIVKSLSEYNKLFDKNIQYDIYGESSVSYLNYEKVIPKLYEYNSDAKILIFLRNPVERTFSHYLMDYSAGYFNDTLEELINNPTTNITAYKQCISQSFYCHQIENVYNSFKKGQVKIIILEEALRNLPKTMEEIEVFLGIENFMAYEFKKLNSYSATDKVIIKSLYRSQDIKNIVKSFLPRVVIGKLKSTFLKADKPQLPIFLREHLQNLYIKDVEALSSIVNKDLAGLWYEGLIKNCKS